MTSKVEQGKGGSHWFFFVDKSKFDAIKPTMTGAEIKQLAGAPAGDGLMLEGHGNDPDRAIGDAEAVDVSQPPGEPKRFRLVPPAAFG